MADTGEIEITGNGEYLLDDAHHLTALYFEIITDTIEVDYRSVYPPRKCIHAGWIATGTGYVGVASGPDVGERAQITWFSYFEFENNLIANPSNFDFDDRIQYNIPPGITAKFVAYW